MVFHLRKEIETTFGEKDNLTSYETMLQFANQTGATLDVMKNGEHWFRTEEQMRFLDKTILEKLVIISCKLLLFYVY